MNTFLMKAHQLNPKKLIPNVTKWSIKLDGMRAFWDGGITHGCTDVPFAKGIKATGLWSINAKVIHAPDWWLETLPKDIFMEGELWAGVGQFQEVMSICKRHVPDERWQKIQFRVFESLIPSVVYHPRIIDLPHCQIVLDHTVRDYMKKRCAVWDSAPEVETVEQYNFTSLDDIPLDALLAEGHEGIMFRNPRPWEPIKSWGIMKLKPFYDDEAIVIGYTGGTDGFIGKIGTIIVRWGTKVFKISAGLNFVDREVQDPAVCAAYAGKTLPPELSSSTLPIGSVVTFKYRELTKEGIPKEARYYRRRV